ncbi:50S ribosomal protein L10 [Corynebacterium sphenisci DSM 44792]|uniref:Large ribosomal subunit protein uL10 n=1 Tax=Corynebacterium sphenisci DSM 44792 TaxID=1437874 RepID=A0A1L7CVY3_9CORY|nr:50S ribosomal protein L10 [Corynebacterium sphenisci]APT89952.1 50S ribosomal protein L10 [Corynebacterium sphenisci DSM 44792]
MAVTPAKEAAVAALKQDFDESNNNVVLTEYRGLSVDEITQLRRALGADVKYSVAKNTMIKLAAAEAAVEGLDEHLTGPTAVAFIKGESVDAAKAIKKFADEHKALVIKGGYVDGSAIDAEQFRALADMDNRETTLAKIAGGFNGVLANVAGLLDAPTSSVARLAAALEEKK